jgi:hypothetical protein
MRDFLPLNFLLFNAIALVIVNMNFGGDINIHIIVNISKAFFISLWVFCFCLFLSAEEDAV